MIYVHINNMYDYACIEMKNVHNVHNATFPLVLQGTIAKSRTDENIYNVMHQLIEYNFVCLFRRMRTEFMFQEAYFKL